MSETRVAGRSSPLPPGDPAPDFELPATPDQKVMLSDFRGQPVILAFYPEDWSPVCSDQLGLYQAVLPEFQKFGAELIGISVDSAWSHLAFAEGSQPALPAARRFRAEGRRRTRVPRLPRRRRDQRAGALRGRRRRCDPVELRLSGRGEPRRRRHPPRAGGAERRGGNP